ncbi:MAG: HAMP domain-containing histidine kinase [Symploca sp. SIO2E9]|nr:HAMP domain-containing histidine kinase [Symploca sp. SIO2E9]
MHDNKTHNQVIIPIEVKQHNDLEWRIEDLNIQLTQERRMRQHLEAELRAERQRAEEEIRQAYNSLEKRATELAAQQLQKSLEELAEESSLALAREQERSRIRFHFFSMASHELRTPLSTILVTIQCLLSFSHKLSDEQTIRKFSQIETAAKRVIQVINDILAINRAETCQTKLVTRPLNLKQFCSNLLEEIKLNASSNHTINFTIQGNYNQVGIDEKNLHSILNNLLFNAIKYSPQGGQIDFDVTCEPAKATFKIQDQGIGICRSDQSHIFEPFYRGENIENITGSGLGLAVVKKCVELQGGRVDLTSEVGVGTTFTVTIPYS